VAAAALGMLLGAAPIVVFSFSVYFKPLSEEFHAGRGAISLAFTAFNLAQALSAPLVGRLVDRIGARAVILSGTALLGLVLLCAKLLGAGIAGMYILFVLLGLTAGCVGFPYGVMISHWFNRKRGLALGLMMLGTGIGAMLAPPVAHRLIAMFGWRSSYALCGCAVLVVALPVGFILLRGDPRDKGLLPDGLPLEETTEPITTSVRGGNEGLSWHETWHKSDFWLLIGSFFLASASVHACILHMSALLTDRGVTAQGAALASSVAGLALMLARVLTGYLLDRIFAPGLAAFFFCGTSLGIAMLMFGVSGTTALAAAFLVGMGLGAEGDIIAYSLTRYFGLKAFGTAYGYAFGSFLLAGALGAYLMGAGFDVFRSYTVPLAGFLAAMLTAAWLMTRLGPYRFVALDQRGKQIIAAPQAGILIEPSL
jgi:MFS family permease